MVGLRNFLNLLAVAALLAGCVTNVSFKNFNEEIDGILRKPEGQGPFPAVVLLHTCGGLRPHVITDWPDYLNELGYVTLAVDSFGSRSLGDCPNRVQRSISIRVTDAYAGLDYLTTLPYVDENKIAVMGFSLGAATINGGLVTGRSKSSRFLGATDGIDFKAAISLYGSCRGMFAITYSMPTMEVVGSRDTKFAVSCSRLANSEAVELHILPDVYHAFDRAEIEQIKDDGFGNPMLYDREATKKAQELTKAFLAKHLGK